MKLSLFLVFGVLAYTQAAFKDAFGDFSDEKGVKTAPPWPPTPQPSSNYELIGCYNSGKGKTPYPLPRWIGNFNYPQAMWKPGPVIEGCAKRVNKRYPSNTHFAISDLGACWTGVDADKTFDLYGESTRCLNGIGYSGALSVYRFKN